MPGAGNGKGGCSCGRLRSLQDPLVVGPGIGGSDYSRIALESLPPGATLRKELTVTAARLRACQGCGQLYALACDDDAKLPEQG